MKYVLYALLLLLVSSSTVNADTCIPTVEISTQEETEHIARWDPIIQQVSVQKNVPADLIARVVVVESMGDPYAISYAGALGLMQIMPFHWYSYENWRDPYTNIAKGTKLLRTNYDIYGDWVVAIRRYAGAGYWAEVYVHKIWEFTCLP